VFLFNTTKGKGDTRRERSKRDGDIYAHKKKTQLSFCFPRVFFIGKKNKQYIYLMRFW